MQRSPASADPSGSTRAIGHLPTVSRKAVLDWARAPDALSRLAAIFELCDDAILAVDMDGVIVAWSRGAERIYGYPAEDILGKSISILAPPERREEQARILACISVGTPVERLETVRLRADGSPIDVSLRTTPTRDPDGRITGAVTIASDITEVKKALSQVEESSFQLSKREEMLRHALVALRRSHEDLKSAQLQLIQAAKLESIGRLAAGVAHEVKNPLAILLSGVDYLSAALPSPDPDTVTTLIDMVEAVRRADSVVRGLLEYSSATELDPTVGDLNDVIEKSLSLVRHALTRSHVEVVKELAGDLPPVTLDRTKIEQVFVNLLINAIDAMPSGGTLTVKTRRDRLKALGPEVGYRKTDLLRIGQSVVVAEIDDTGTGMDEQCLARMFDPFYTTKPAGKGTGLGLAVCKTIVALHGGTIQIANRDEGGGARATVLFCSHKS